MALKELLYLLSVLAVCWGSGREYGLRTAPTSMIPELRSRGLASVGPGMAVTQLPGGVQSPSMPVSPSGENVCSHEVLKTDWQQVTVTYVCWQTEEVDLSFCRDRSRGRRRCYWGRDWRPEWRRHRGKRQSDRCYKLVAGTCSKTVMKLVSHTIKEYVCCPGYEGDASTGCYGSSSCSVNNGGCEQICTHDASGTPRCACYPGFRMMGQKCIDLNECLSSPCNHRCENTEGSFYCACNTGYSLISPTHCAETNECGIGNGGCQHNCVNTRGAFYCTCEGGFDLETGFQCDDTDECALHNGGCSHTCDNQYGYYECLCPENAYLQKDNKTCTTITPVVDPPKPPVPDVPGAERRHGHSEDGLSVSMVIIIAPCIGAVLLIIAALIIGCCCYRRCQRTHAEHPPPTPVFPVVAVISENDYEDPAICALKKKKEAESGVEYVGSGPSFDNPGYKPSPPPNPPPSYTDHSYCYIDPPKYKEREDLKPAVEKASVPEAKAVQAEYDNTNQEKKPNSVKKLLENFENKAGNMEKGKNAEDLVKSQNTEEQAASTLVVHYDNVLNDLKKRDK